jgi:cation diffusion facilitator family transporter
MIAEAVHSWVDTCNEVFVVGAARTARRPADSSRPLGYGRESYVWALFASIGSLVTGSVLTIMQALWHLHRGESPGKEGLTVSLVILAISFLLEGSSFLQSVRTLQSQARKRQRGLFAQVLKTSDSSLAAVFFEDFIALISIVIAALGLSLSRLFGLSIIDILGALLIGLLLGVSAIILINKNRIFLEGRPFSRELRAFIIKRLLAMPEICRVTFVYGEIIGPNRVLLVAGVELAGEHTQSEAALLLRQLEKRIAEEYEDVGLPLLTLAAPDEEDAVT